MIWLCIIFLIIKLICSLIQKISNKLACLKELEEEKIDLIEKK